MELSTTEQEASALGTPILSFALSSGTAGNAGLPMSIIPTTLNPNGGRIINCGIKNGTRALPSYFRVDPNTCAISGTPSAPLPPTRFVLVAVNSVGPSMEADVTITADSGIPILDYTNSNGTTGYTNQDFQVSPSVFRSHDWGLQKCETKPGTLALPTGVSITNDCTIVGNSTKPLSKTEYTIRATNLSGLFTEAKVVLEIKIPPPALVYQSQTTGKATQQFSLKPLTFDTFGSLLRSCTLTLGSAPLPKGLSVNNTTCTIEGTPELSSPVTTYTISVVTSAGTTTTTFSLTILDAPPSQLTYLNPSIIYIEGQPIQENTPTNLGGLITSYSVNPQLPGGLTLNSSTGVITGTPLYLAPSTKYTITGKNSGGSITASIYIGVKAPIIPDDPTSIRVAFLDYYNIAIEWDAPVFNQKYFLGYKTSMAKGSVAPSDCQAGVNNGSSKRASFSALESGTTYSFRVCSYYGSSNPGGESSPGTTITISTPQRMVAKAIAAGGFHNCASDDTKLFCWGSNQYGQLGSDTTPYGFYNQPKPVAGVDGTGYLTGVKSFSAGMNHSCAVTSENSVACWGWNLQGQLGNGTKNDSNFPVIVSGGLEAKIVSTSGAHTCALTTLGTVFCWGDNSVGQLGNGSLQSADIPTAVIGLTDITQISAGNGRTCALSQDGSVFCWGVVNPFSNPPGTIKTPTKVLTSYQGPPLSAIVNVQTAYRHTCAISSNGNSWCWGYNQKGQMGYNYLDTYPRFWDPVKTFDVGASFATGGGATSYLSKLTSVTVGPDSSCAIDQNNSVFCWGDNSDEKLGIKNEAASAFKTPVKSGFNDIKSISIGSRHSCALTTSGKIFCAGNNSWSQLGNLGFQPTEPTTGVYGFH